MKKEYEAKRRARAIKQWAMAPLFVGILAGGWKWPLLGYFIPFCMVVGMVIPFFRGRQWCDWYCPRGSFLDTVVKRVSPGKEIPRFFKGLPLRVGMLSFLMTMMVVQIIRFWPDPYKIGMFFVVLLTVTTALGVAIAIKWHQRTWCCFCPIGSMGNWLGAGRYPLKIDSGKCTVCKLCYKVCPIQVAPYHFKKEGVEMVRDADCLKCGLCVAACPTTALSF